MIFYYFYSFLRGKKVLVIIKKDVNAVTGKPVTEKRG